MRGLYAIVDTGFLAARGVEPLEFARQLLGAPLAALQLRAKSDAPARTLSLATALSALCREPPAGARPVPFVVNDRADLARLAKATGVHLGQEDLPVAAVRKTDPSLTIGLSTHSLEQVDEALGRVPPGTVEGGSPSGSRRPDYVAFGPVFATESKRGAEPVVGRALLAEAVRRCRRADVPCVAIGGFTADRLLAISAEPDAPDAIAVISALWPPQGGLDGVTDWARSLCERLASGPASS